MEKICVTFVSEDVETLLKPQGVENVYGALKQLRECKYIIFAPRVRESMVKHIAADTQTKILVGKIAYVTDMELSSKKSRRLVGLSAHAIHFVPDSVIRRYQVKPPSTYANSNDLDIEFAELDWIENQPITKEAITKVNLTIEEAKRAIANSMGLDPSCITLKIEVTA